MSWLVNLLRGLKTGMAVKGSLESARGGVSQGGDPFALGGLRGTLAGEVTGRPQRQAPVREDLGRYTQLETARLRSHLDDDRFWADYDF